MATEPEWPPEWVQHALAAEVAATFGEGAQFTMLEGKLPAVTLTAGRGRYAVARLRSTLKNDDVQEGDELDFELFWRPDEAIERRAQAESYGALIDYEAFASKAGPLYRAWRFFSSQFPFSIRVGETLDVESARWSGAGLLLRLRGRDVTFGVEEWFAPLKVEQAARLVREKLEGEGLVAAAASAADWLGRFRQEFVSLARDAIFRADHSAHGRVTAEPAFEQKGEGFVLDRIRTLLAYRDRAGALQLVNAGVDRPRMSSVLQQEMGGARVILGPFAWHACPVHIVGVPSLGVNFNEWFHRWFEPHRPIEEKALNGVLHFVRQPKAMPHGMGLELTVNFGSAPVEAALELIEALAPNAQLVTLGVEPHELNFRRA